MKKRNILPSVKSSKERQTEAINRQKQVEEEDVFDTGKKEPAKPDVEVQVREPERPPSPKEYSLSQNLNLIFHHLLQKNVNIYEKNQIVEIIAT